MNNQTQSDVALHVHVKEKATRIKGEMIQLVEWEDIREENGFPIEDDNEGYTFGVYFIDETAMDAQWFVDEVSRRSFIIDNSLVVCK